MSKIEKMSSSSFECDNNVVHGGMITHKVKGKLTTSYHLSYCTLHRDSLDELKRFELKDSQTGKVSVVVLSQLLDVKENLKKQKDLWYPFEVMCLKSKHTFVTDTPEERVEWIAAIKRLFSGEPEPGVTYEFRVTVQANESSKRYGLSGRYILHVSETCLRLYSATGLIETAFRLRLSDIKRLQQCSLMEKSGVKEDILVIYSMPNTCIGEGIFVFSSPKANEISNLIDKRIKLLLDCGLSLVDDNSPMSSSPPVVPDRKNRGNHPFDGYPFHEDSSSDLGVFHPLRKSKMSTSSDCAVLAHSLPVSEFERLKNQSHMQHRHTLSSIRHQSSTDQPPAPPPRHSLQHHASVSGAVDSGGRHRRDKESILVETKDILESVQDLRKKGYLRGVSLDKTPSPPPRRPQGLRNYSEQKLRNSPTRLNSDCSLQRESSGSPPFSSTSSPTATVWSPSSPPGGSPQSLSEWSASHQQTRKVTANQAFLQKSHSGDTIMPLRSSSSFQRDPTKLVKRHNTAEQLRLSDWLPQKLQQSRGAAPEPTSRHSSNSSNGESIYYLSNRDINPGPVNSSRRVPSSVSSPVDLASVSSSSTDDNGYIILKADEREAMRQLAQEYGVQSKILGQSGEISPTVSNGNVTGNPSHSERDQSPLTTTNGFIPTSNGVTSNGERESVNSPISSSSGQEQEGEREDSSSPYYSMSSMRKPLLRQNQVGTGHASSVVDGDDSDFDNAASWTQGVKEDSPEYYNTVPAKGPTSALVNGGGLGGREVSPIPDHQTMTGFAHQDSDSDCYLEPSEIVKVAKVSKRVLVRKSSSITGLDQITPSVSAVDYGSLQGEHGRSNDSDCEREVSQLTKQRKTSSVYQSFDNLQPS